MASVGARVAAPIKQVDTPPSPSMEPEDSGLERALARVLRDAARRHGIEI
jgi:hypothetical protein